MLNDLSMSLHDDFMDWAFTQKNCQSPTWSILTRYAAQHYPNSTQPELIKVWKMVNTHTATRDKNIDTLTSMAETLDDAVKLITLLAKNVQPAVLAHITTSHQLDPKAIAKNAKSLIIVAKDITDHFYSID